MVAAISGGLTSVQVDWLDLRVGGQPALSLHLSNEAGELSQWLCHDDSTINIISVIIVIIIIDGCIVWNATVQYSARNDPRYLCTAQAVYFLHSTMPI